MPEQKPQPLYINRFIKGLVTQRSPLITPFSFIGINVLQHNDALIDGLNMEITPNYSLARRPGYTRFCSAQLGAEIPLWWGSARLNNAVQSLVDTTTRFCKFTSSAITTIWSKTGGAGQTFSQQIGNKLYFADGQVHKKWDGTTVTNCGIAAPGSAPTVVPTNASDFSLRFWAASHAYSGDTIHLQTTIPDLYGNIERWLGGGINTTGTVYPPFPNTTGNQTTDNSQSWFGNNPNLAWQANFNMSAVTGANNVIVDSNNNFQITAGGTTGATVPSWNGTTGGTTTDNTVTWYNIGTAQQVVFYGYKYVYCYHTTSGHVSTASTSTYTGPAFGKAWNVAVGGAYSTQTDCDFIWIFRTADGGATFQFLDSVANNVAGGTWSYTDTKLDSQLNPLILAPLAHANDPPPAGMTINAYHMGRRWGAVGNLLYFAAGPDTITGNGDESWPPANVVPFPSSITGLFPTSKGLLVFLKDQMWVMLGGPQTLTFYPQQVFNNFGVSSPNCIAQDGDTIFAYTSSSELFEFTIDGRNEIGAANRSLIASTFSPVSSYVALHRNGADFGVFLSDNSANTMRYDLNLGAWSTIAQPVGGVGAIGSVETAFGVYGLMAGRPSTLGFILERTLSDWSDDGQTYSGFANIGSITLSQPGTAAQPVEAIVLQYTNQGSLLGLGVLLNEISGTFLNLPIAADDPWQFPASATLHMKRHDVKGAQIPPNMLVRHMQIQISLQSENAFNEVLGVAFCPEVK